ncbi:hypothetical protein PSP6_540045 [Paraburkholderia tropica]|nr:hypothetical protein PSP6_540045 [Paraburkholderia tropica]
MLTKRRRVYIIISVVIVRVGAHFYPN